MTSRSKICLSAVAIALLSHGSVMAEPRSGGDRLWIEDAESHDIDVPSRGMNMENVRNVHGEPRDIEGPVGDPPITRWVYEDYSVYFEHELVLHTVLEATD
ncbi:hypothetical protein J2T60_000662 [Natronospira proteinivora]|uniref:Phosphodiesterase n=1 Tax=Natronospira proteinivora TaxID=1807133 RepID=A0ABT1G9T1_9GAMM|nr:hypothetical protein [Natronospira proteinivora]MCP1726697.1 hypothetical protein [Natronospira proteinivora]